MLFMQNDINSYVSSIIALIKADSVNTNYEVKKLTNIETLLPKHLFVNERKLRICT